MSIISSYLCKKVVLPAHFGECAEGAFAATEKRENLGISVSRRALDCRAASEPRLLCADGARPTAERRENRSNSVSRVILKSQRYVRITVTLRGRFPSSRRDAQ